MRTHCVRADERLSTPTLTTGATTMRDWLITLTLTFVPIGYVMLIENAFG